MSIDLSKSDRELLKAIYRLSKDGSDVHTGELALKLGVTPGTVTASVKRLAERALIDHRPYRGVELTDEGRKAAVGAIRRHRIVERFLSDMLGYAWNEADRLAANFEHELPQEVEDRLYVALDRPASCPHGFPIPEPDGLDVPDLPPLYALDAGDIATVAVPGSTQPEVIEFLDTLGLRPGVRVEVREKHPFDGPLVVRVDGSDRTIGEKVANQVFVRIEKTRAKSKRKSNSKAAERKETA
jgi:DtxR family transcriptional regulator, Mn-dependent transcriptional regulator